MVGDKTENDIQRKQLRNDLIRVDSKKKEGTEIVQLKKDLGITGDRTDKTSYQFNKVSDHEEIKTALNEFIKLALTFFGFEEGEKFSEEELKSRKEKIINVIDEMADTLNPITTAPEQKEDQELDKKVSGRVPWLVGGLTEDELEEKNKIARHLGEDRIRRSLARWQDDGKQNEPERDLTKKNYKKPVR